MEARSSRYRGLGLSAFSSQFVALSQELIQNADDAGATTVKFLWDETQYPTEKVFKGTEKYQVSRIHRWCSQS